MKYSFSFHFRFLIPKYWLNWNLERVVARAAYFIIISYIHWDYLTCFRRDYNVLILTRYVLCMLIPVTSIAFTTACESIRSSMFNSLTLVAYLNSKFKLKENQRIHWLRERNNLFENEPLGLSLAFPFINSTIPV